MNEAADAWSAEELAQLKIDYEEYKAAKEAGTQWSNSACSADATSTGEKLFEELILLKKQTGARGFLVITKGHVNDKILNMPINSLPLKYKRWATAEADKKLAKSQDKWAEVVEMIRTRLNAMFSTPDQTMNYKKYCKVIQAGWGFSWPDWDRWCKHTGFPLGALEVKEAQELPDNVEAKAGRSEDGGSQGAQGKLRCKEDGEEVEKKAKEGGGDGGEGQLLKKSKAKEGGGEGGKEQPPKKSKAKEGSGDGRTEKEQKKQEEKKKEGAEAEEEGGGGGDTAELVLKGNRMHKAVEAVEGDEERLKMKAAFSKQQTGGPLTLKENEAAKVQMAAAATEAGPSKSKSNKGKGKAKAKPAPCKISTIGKDSDSSYNRDVLMDYDGPDLGLNLLD
ncbi:hypothetical protein B0H14DRAFT_2654250 [Mycena olivaceomarginata]|nr:hypothetical protein B0H14DRAFT_2654250 [Mycena olivaceomarginata]